MKRVLKNILDVNEVEKINVLEIWVFGTSLRDFGEFHYTRDWQAFTDFFRKKNQFILKAWKIDHHFTLTVENMHFKFTYPCRNDSTSDACPSSISSIW